MLFMVAHRYPKYLHQQWWMEGGRGLACCLKLWQPLDHRLRIYARPNL